MDVRKIVQGQPGFVTGTTSELLSFSALMNFMGKKSRQSIYDLMRRDPTFPRPRQLASEFSIAWDRQEVLAWWRTQPRQTFDGLSAVEKRKRAEAA
jgi:predicted DNA-binding transcriptional regulator AlpA